ANRPEDEERRYAAEDHQQASCLEPFAVGSAAGHETTLSMNVSASFIRSSPEISFGSRVSRSAAKVSASCVRISIPVSIGSTSRSNSRMSDGGAATQGIA